MKFLYKGGRPKKYATHDEAYQVTLDKKKEKRQQDKVELERLRKLSVEVFTLRLKK